MSLFESFFLGLLQGITEFLPISSSGHLVLFRTVFNIDPEYGLMFDAMLHLATVTAVIVYFRQDLYLLMQTLARKMGKLPIDEKQNQLLACLLIATLPGALVGWFFEDILSNIFHSPIIVGVLLITSAIFFIFAEYFYQLLPRIDTLSYRKALYIGLFQVAALLPGISRSGVTIGAGMLLGLTRTEAARFSFLLAIPITLGVGLKQTLEFIVVGGEMDIVFVSVAFVTSFISAFIVIHFFMLFLRKYSLWPFVWYLLIIGTLILIAQYLV